MSLISVIKDFFEIKIDIVTRDNDNYIFIDAFIKSRKVGELRALFENDKALLADIIIHERNINKGIGTKLITKFEELCIEKGVSVITGNLANVDLNHKDRLIHFYLKNKYEIIYENEEKLYWGKIIKHL